MAKKTSKRKNPGPVVEKKNDVVVRTREESDNEPNSSEVGEEVCL